MTVYAWDHRKKEVYEVADNRIGDYFYDNIVMYSTLGDGFFKTTRVRHVTMHETLTGNDIPPDFKMSLLLLGVL